MPKLGTIFQDIYHQNLGMNRYIRVTLHSLSDTHDTPSNANKKSLNSQTFFLLYRCEQVA